MKDIRLIGLGLRNFKGMSFNFSPGGGTTELFGRNKTGKTTIADAYFFLVTGKNSRGAAKFDIKTNLPDGKHEEKAEHEVAGLFEVNGVPVELKCVYHEVWKQTRGKLEDKMSGHTTDYYIDGIEVQEGPYKARVTEMMGDPQTFSLVSNPMYFIDLAAEKWQIARPLLMKHFSTLTDDEVFDSSDELRGLRETLKALRRDVKIHKEASVAAQKTVQKQKDDIPVAIKENKRILDTLDVTGLDRKMLTGRIAELEASLDAARLRLSGVDNGSAITDLTKKVAVINNDIQALELTHYNAVSKDIAKITQQIDEIAQRGDAARRKATTAQGEIDAKTRRTGSIGASLDALRAQWMEINAAAFHDTTDDTCPTCRRPLPAEQVEAVWAKALANHNLWKAERLADIDAKGSELKEEKGRLQEQITALAATAQAHDEGAIESEIQELREKRDTMKAAAQNYSQVNGWALKMEEKATIEARIAAERDGVKEAREVVQAEVDSLNAQLTEAQALAKRFIDRKEREERIEELKAEEKKLAAEYERLKKEQFLCEKFSEMQARMAEGEVNGHFKLAKFVLFETQINEGTKEACLVTEGGNIAGRGLNTGTMMNVGVDICQAFTKVLGLRCPIVIDNAEAASSWIETDAQVIRFNVSPEDKVLRLRVETAKEPERKRAGMLV